MGGISATVSPEEQLRNGYNAQRNILARVAASRSIADLSRPRNTSIAVSVSSKYRLTAPDEVQWGTGEVFQNLRECDRSHR